MSREIQTHPTAPMRPMRAMACAPMVTIVLCLSVAAAGCLGGCLTNPQPPHFPPDFGDSADHGAKIESLKAAIERDHRTLENLITQPGLAADRSLDENPELRAIAERLTAQERALEELEARPSSRSEESGPSE